MVAKASIIEIYAKADAARRVDIICKNYSNFIGIVGLLLVIFPEMYWKVLTVVRNIREMHTPFVE